MKIWSDTHIFEHPWETVVQACWRKYPNPMNTNVQGTDVVDRSVDQNGVLHSHRLMTTDWAMPGWVARLVGMPERMYISEHSEVNPEEKSMAMKSRNLTLANFITVDEHLVYKQHPENPQMTLLSQEAVVHIQGIPMTDYLEGVVFGNISSNAQKGRQAMEWVISKVKDEAKDLARTVENVKGLARTANETVESHFKTSKPTTL